MRDWASERREEKRLKLERREAIRPLREMLKDTQFGVGLPWVKTRKVLITYGFRSRSIAWEDCADKAIVADLQRAMLADAEELLAAAWEDVVMP